MQVQDEMQLSGSCILLYMYMLHIQPFNRDFPFFCTVEIQYTVMVIILVLLFLLDRYTHKTLPCTSHTPRAAICLLPSVPSRRSAAYVDDICETRLEWMLFACTDSIATLIAIMEASARTEYLTVTTKTHRALDCFTFSSQNTLSVGEDKKPHWHC